MKELPTQSDHLSFWSTKLQEQPKKSWGDNIRLLDRLEQKEMYRFFVDGSFHSNEDGWFGYSRRQAGSVASLFTAMSYALESPAGVSTSMIEKLHYRVVNLPKYGCFCRELFRKTPSCFEMIFNRDLNNLSKEGFIELFDTSPERFKLIKKLGNELTYGEQIINMEGTVLPSTPVEAWEFLQNLGGSPYDYRLFFIAPNYDNIIKLIDEACSEYNSKAANQALSVDETIRLIANFIQTLERIHPFEDGNLRVCLVLLQKLLLENNLLPTILYDPNIFDGHSFTEVTEAIISGIKLTEQLINNPDEPIFDYISLSYEELKCKHTFLDWHIEVTTNATQNLIHAFLNQVNDDRPTSRISNLSS